MLDRGLVQVLFRCREASLSSWKNGEETRLLQELQGGSKDPVKHGTGDKGQGCHLDLFLTAQDTP